MKLICKIAAALVFVGHSMANAGDSEALITTAERTEYRQTGRYDEVARLCAAYQRAWPRAIRCFQFGVTPEGRAMWALAASSDGALSAAEARRRDRPVVLLQGGIHPGEIDGKDAGFIALRDLLGSETGRARLRAATVLFVPVFNVDGHERFGAWNRPNQRGPEAMGWRTTAQNLNLNRDYVKAEAPEMRAMLTLLADWDPLVYADLHVTDGADFEHDISITSTMALAGDVELSQVAQGLVRGILADLTKHGSLPLDFYPSFVVDDRPDSGFAVTIAPPRYSDSYWALRNRIGVLVETHSWKPYAQRVASTRATIDSILAQVAEHGAAWRAVAQAADRRAAALGGQSVALSYTNTDHVKTIDFRGYEYQLTPSPVSGALAIHYDPKRPTIWRVPLRDQIKPKIEEAAPRAGYLVPPAFAEPVRTRLLAHRLAFETLRCQVRGLGAEVFRAHAVTRSASSFEGRPVVSVDGEWTMEAVDSEAGALFVPIAQPAARLVMALLEPRAPDSLVSWGYYDVVFEQREYMESYVAEQVADEMLARDPALGAEFAARLRDDPKFAADPQARRDFFYQRHASWDRRLRLVPIYRVASTPRCPPNK